MKGSVHANKSGEFIRGLLVFLVAFLLGVSVTVGAIVGGIYAAFAYVTIDTLDGLGITFADRFLEEDSELRHLSVIGMVGEIMALSGNLSATTFNSLMQQYGVIVSDDVRDYIPDGLVDLPFSEFAGDDALHVLLSHVKFADVFEISGEVLPEALTAKISSRTLDLAFEKKLDKLFEGVYLGDVIDVALEVRDNGMVYPVVDEGERPSVVEYLGTLDMGAFFAAEDNEGKDAVLNATLSRIPLTDMIADEDTLFGDSISNKTLGDLLIIRDLSFLFSMEPLLEDLYLGHILGYHPVCDEVDGTILYWASDADDKPAKGLYREIVGIAINDLDNTDIMARIDNVYVAELMDYDRVEEVDAETGETVYRFYKCDKDGNWLYDEHGNLIEPSGMTADLAVLTIGELRNEDTLNEEIRGMQIGTVMGYTLDENGIWRNEAGAAQGVMRPLLGSTVGTLDEDMDNLYLGQMMGYDVNKDSLGNFLDKAGVVIPLDEDGNLTQDPFFYKDVNHNGIYDPQEGADDRDFDTLPGALMGEFVSMSLADIDDESEFTGRVKNVRVGDAMGYTEVNGVWYEKDADGTAVPVKGLFASLADSKVNELDGAVQELAISDALGYEKVDGKWLKDGKEATGIFRVLMEKEANLNNISDKSKEIELGEIMGYTKTDDGYEKDGAPVSGIIGEFVDLCVGDLEDDKALTDTINGMALGTAMGYTYDEENDVWLDKNNAEATGFMELIGPGTTIVELDDAIAKLKTPEKGSIQAFMNAGILELDDTTVDILDARLDGWREMSINGFVNGLIGLIRNPQP